MPTIIKNQPPTTEIRKKLAADKKPLLVAFSGGKDAIAAELSLRDVGLETTLVYMYYIPGISPGSTLKFVEDGLKYQEDKLGKQIHRYPHPSLWRWLNAFVFQPPERCPIIEAAQMPTVEYDEMWDFIRQDLKFPKETIVADGVRAADSIVRRASLSRHGILKAKKVSPIADWLKKEVLERIERENISLPIDYQWFGRSFDGIDYRFLEPISRNAPDDYQRILDWFPLADLEIYRKQIGKK